MRTAMVAATMDLERGQVPLWRVAFLPGNPMRPWLLGFMGFTLLGLVAMLVLWASPLPGWIAAAVGSVAAAMVICTLVFWGFAHATGNRILEAYRQGFWATWSVGSDEWRSHARREDRHAMRQTLTTTALIIGAICVGFLIAGIDDPELMTLSYWLIGIAAGLGVLGGGIAVVVQKRRWSRPVGGRDIEVRFTYDGYIADGHYTLLRGMGTRIEDVEVQLGTHAEPTTLAFHISTVSRYGRQHRTVRVPVPAGKEAEAEALAERYESGVA